MGECRWRSLSKTEPEESPVWRGRGNEEELAAENEKIHEVGENEAGVKAWEPRQNELCAKCSREVSEDEDKEERLGFIIWRSSVNLKGQCPWNDMGGGGVQKPHYNGLKSKKVGRGELETPAQSTLLRDLNKTVGQQLEGSRGSNSMFVC